MVQDYEAVQGRSGAETRCPPLGVLVRTDQTFRRTFKPCLTHLTAGARLGSLGEIKFKGGSSAQNSPSLRLMWQEIYQSHTNRLNLEMTEDFETDWQGRLEFQMQTSWTN